MKMTLDEKNEVDIQMLNMRMDAMEKEWLDMKRELLRFVKKSERWRLECNRKLRQK